MNFASIGMTRLFEEFVQLACCLGVLFFAARWMRNKWPDRIETMKSYVGRISLYTSLPGMAVIGGIFEIVGDLTYQRMYRLFTLPVASVLAAIIIGALIARLSERFLQEHSPASRQNRRLVAVFAAFRGLCLSCVGLMVLLAVEAFSRAGR